MKLEHTLATIGGILILAAYVEAYFEHPTCGRGLRAVSAALQLAKFA